MIPALTSALHPFCSSSLCHNAAILVTPASVRGMGQSDAECLEQKMLLSILFTAVYVFFLIRSFFVRALEAVTENGGCVNRLFFIFCIIKHAAQKVGQKNYPCGLNCMRNF